MRRAVDVFLQVTQDLAGMPELERIRDSGLLVGY